MNNQQKELLETALQVLKKNGHTPETLLNKLKHEETITFDSLTFQCRGVCRYYSINVKPSSSADSEYICLKSWAD